MKPSAKTLYACQALIELARQYPTRQPVFIEDIAKRQNIPLKFLQQILLSLKGARLLESRRGPEGGYLLAKPPGQITLLDIVQALETPASPAPPGQPRTPCANLPVWQELEQAERSILQSYTLEKLDFLTREPEDMYYI